ncbi:MAG: class D beta-lactamase [Bacteroidales bacterium]|nr:class D beta-lactamase [Bacteroidales bacterium]
MKFSFLTVIIIAIFNVAFSQTIVEKNFKPYFDKHGVEGCFVLFDPSDNEYIMYNLDICKTEYTPASTFKIPNSVIALEEGIIEDTNEIIKWDSTERSYKVWNQDQTLKTAIKYSCVWVYVKFADQIGIDKYQKYVEGFDYGNKNLNGPANSFWLEGDFAISAIQQVDFLKKFYFYELPVSKNSIDIVKDIIIIEKTDDYQISGKTGAGKYFNDQYIMWLVGYIEKDGKPYFYALNFTTADFNGKLNARFQITKDILIELGLI